MSYRNTSAGHSGADLPRFVSSHKQQQQQKQQCRKTTASRSAAAAAWPHLHDVEPYEEREERVAVDVQGIHPLNLLLHGVRPMLQQAAVGYPPATDKNKRQPCRRQLLGSTTTCCVEYARWYRRPTSAVCHQRHQSAKNSKQAG